MLHPDCEMDSATSSFPKEGKKKMSDTEDLVTFRTENPVADFIERELLEYDHAAAKAFADQRQRGTEDSSFTMTLYGVLCLTAEVGYLLEDVLLGKVSADDLPSPGTALQKVIDSLVKVIDEND